MKSENDAHDTHVNIIKPIVNIFGDCTTTKFLIAGTDVKPTGLTCSFHSQIEFRRGTARSAICHCHLNFELENSNPYVGCRKMRL